jgi:hypothetical protein
MGEIVSLPSPLSPPNCKSGPYPSKSPVAFQLVQSKPPRHLPRVPTCRILSRIGQGGRATLMVSPVTKRSIDACDFVPRFRFLLSNTSNMAPSCLQISTSSTSSKPPCSLPRVPRSIFSLRNSDASESRFQSYSNRFETCVIFSP